MDNERRLNQAHGRSICADETSVSIWLTDTVVVHIGFCLVGIDGMAGCTMFLGLKDS